MVNVAARLQSLAEPGEVLLGPETTALVTGWFELTDLGERKLKGRREAVRVARVERPTADPVRRSGRSGAFVGRRDELRALHDAVDGLRRGRPAVISVCGEAGVGKTRLLDELRAIVDEEVHWYEGRAYPYTANMPLAPLIDLVNRAAGIVETDSAADVEDKLRAAVGRPLPDDRLAVAVIGQLYGVTPADGRIDLEAFRTVLVEAFARLLDAAARRRPVVVCLQDLHWVDPSTAEVLRRLVQAISEPAVILCAQRPGVELSIPGEQVLRLETLSDDEVHDQLASLLDGDPPAALVTLVTTRADGNPFFAEELVNSLLDTDALVRTADGWTIADDVDTAGVPTTIQALVAARIDRLDHDAKRVLREASVVGREFLYRIVRAVSDEPDGVEGRLAGLSTMDLIRQQSVDPELEYVFKHALTQEVAYEGLTRRDRARLHDRVARAIEELLPDRVEEFVETLAYHYERSGQLLPAVEHLRRSGRKARDRYALAEAHELCRTAHGLLTSPEADPSVPPEVRDRLLMETILEWSQVHYFTGEMAELHRLHRRPRRLAGGDVPPAGGAAPRLTRLISVARTRTARLPDVDRAARERHPTDGTAPPAGDPGTRPAGHPSTDTTAAIRRSPRRPAPRSPSVRTPTPSGD